MTDEQRPEDFMPGKIVRLRSGGPNMTISHTGNNHDAFKVGTVHVKWFTSEGVLQSGSFDARALRPVRYKARKARKAKP
jgi:uncharacterized protein YodC (DUF2158 family)